MTTSITQASSATPILQVTLPDRGCTIKSISVPQSVSSGAINLSISDSVGVRYDDTVTTPIPQAAPDDGYYLELNLHCVGAATVTLTAGTSYTSGILHVTFD